MVDAIFHPILIGLWAWLFTETLTNEGHVFHFLNQPQESHLAGPALLWSKYTNCGVCHAGIMSLAYTVFCAIDNGLNEPSLALIPYAFATSLFTSATVAMSVAKVCSLKL